VSALEGEKKKIEWGSQIRSYVLQPYQQVNDHRTELKSSAVHSPLDGDLDEFIEAFLLQSVPPSPKLSLERVDPQPDTPALAHRLAPPPGR
jgi:hypothetical protein